MRPLPLVTTLQEAVATVIESNKRDGYPPTRLIAMTGGGHVPNLLAVCERLILKGETLEYLDKALVMVPTLLTLEDLVAAHGATWGFSSETMAIARARATYFDQVAQQTRYE